MINAYLQRTFFVLIDRLWPHGLSKQESNIDLWFKEIAPSDSLENGSIMIQINGRNSKRDITKN
jgi:uncharacterized protein YeaO (DUF488 family)